MRAALIPLAFAAFAGTAAPAADRDPLAGRAAGAPVDCIDASIGGPEIVDDRTLLYRDGRRVWRNDLPSACPGLQPISTLIVERYGSQSCRNDHFRAVDPGRSIPGPICRLGRFTPYDRAK